MSQQEARESAAVASISSRGFDPSRWRTRPFRAPHHTSSAVALVGGGSQPRPGEISLAHHGVLFLDELPEFSRQVLEVLREPMDSGRILISRAARQAEFPARFQLVAAMNPCPCGHAGDPLGQCRCTAEQILRYHARVSGPLLDRIDMHIEVPRPPETVIYPEASGGETSAPVRQRVCEARQQQYARQDCANALLDVDGISRHCRLEPATLALMQEAAERLALSPRASHRVLKVARTIADLEGHEAIDRNDLGEAISYRRKRQAAAFSTT